MGHPSYHLEVAAAHCAFSQSTILLCCRRRLQVLAKCVHTCIGCVRGCVRALLHVCACGGGSCIRTCACFVFVCSVCACLKVYNHTMRTGCIRAYVCVVCAFMYTCVNCASGHVTGCSTSVVCSATRQRLQCSLVNIITLQGLH